MSKVKAFDAVDPVGTLSISVDYHQGKGKEVIFKEDNLVVKAAKQFLLSGLYTAAVVSDPLANLKVGTGGNIDPAGLYAKPEDPLQTDLITPILTIPLTYTLDLANVTVTFLADVDQSQCNGVMLTEAGMFKTSGLIFNIKNHPGINKNSQFSIHYSWAVKFQ